MRPFSEASMLTSPSLHAQVRMRQRGLSAEDIQWIQHYGNHYYAGGGLEVYWLSRRAVGNARHRYGIRLDTCTNWACVVTSSGRLVTAYKAGRRLPHWHGGRP